MQDKEDARSFWAKAVSGEQAQLMLMRKYLEEAKDRAEKDRDLAQAGRNPVQKVDAFSLHCGEIGAALMMLDYVEYLEKRQRECEVVR